MGRFTGNVYKGGKIHLSGLLDPLSPGESGLILNPSKPCPPHPLFGVNLSLIRVHLTEKQQRSLMNGIQSLIVLLLTTGSTLTPGGTSMSPSMILFRAGRDLPAGRL